MNNTLKVGDLVKVIRVTQMDIFMGVQLGGIYRVSRAAQDAATYIETAREPEVYVTSSQYVPVRQSTQVFDGFQVGDTVERTSDVHESGMTPGMTDVITEVLADDDVPGTGQFIGAVKVVFLRHFPGCAPHDIT
ncbi:P38 [Xanthomonas phage phiL7]|uniref:p38 n=1 Tax=Xanthomonas phage phiL7 TaxID=538979 RepID=C4ML38_9CAUD|nr:P38 [Xanthomonas phage phiL7]ACE75778.1 P38 [Xanthomonas phage phiL7]